MNGRRRLSMEVSPEVDELLETLAKEANTTKTEIFRRAIAFMKAAREQKKLGRSHVGFTADAGKLDAEILGVID